MGQLDNIPRHYRNLILLTGPRESGKTSLLVRWLVSWKEKLIDTAGVISPAVFNNGSKTGIDLLDIRSGIRQSLAQLRMDNSTGVMTDRWHFDSSTLDWGNQILLDAVPCDLLIVDELGPIEFDRGLGLQAGLSALDSGKYKAALVIIRPELLDQASQRWPGSVIFDITVDDPSGVSGLIQKAIALGN